MDLRFNTIAGWVLGSGIVALGLSSLSSHYFQADKPERPATMGYAIAGVGGGAASSAVPIEALLAKADPAKGADVFKKCASCHTVNQGGAMGRGGFAFSDGLTKLGGKWDFAALNKWLTDPRGMVAGTKMTFAGLDDPQDRANVMAYLNTQGSNLPLPKVPAGAAAAGAAPAAVAVVGDATKGQAVFQKCAACHTDNAGGANGIGPNLSHIVGDDVGKGRGGFAFSDGLTKVGGKWDAAKLDKWLTDPRGMVSGPKMTFAGIDNAQDRADVIAFLKAN